MGVRRRSGRVRGPRATPVVLGLILFMAGCGAEKRAVTPEEAEEVSRVAEPAAAELLRTLVGRLTAAMEEGGAAAALEFCSEEAIPLTRMVQSRVEGAVELKRTSFRYRNPDNAPDSLEAEALLYFEKAMETGESPPAAYVQSTGLGEYRYYKPLFVGPMCLACHGDPETLAPEVRSVLAERYPTDLATGYRAGDLRGVVRVTVRLNGTRAP